MYFSQDWRKYLSDRVIFIAFYFTIAGIAGIGVLAFLVLERTVESEAWALRAAVGIAKIEGLHQTLVEAESTGRGFLVSGNSQLRESYEKILADMDSELLDLNKWSADNVAQRELVAQLEPHINRRFAYLSGLVGVRASRGLEAMQSVAIGSGIREMRSITVIIERMKETERQVLAQSIDVRRQQHHLMKYALAVLIVVGIGIMSAIFWYMNYLWTANRRAEARASHLAHHDSLTGLPNRRLLEDRIAVAINHARRYGEIFAVLFLDLDGFKSVNDLHGHAIGDELLRLVGSRLVASLRSEDTVARLGGDEFVVVLAQIKESAYTGLVAEKIIRQISVPFDVAGKQLSVTTSVGIAIYATHGSTSDDLFKCADAALYKAKTGGRQCYVVAVVQ